jgi:hypothetical protein
MVGHGLEDAASQRQADHRQREHDDIDVPSACMPTTSTAVLTASIPIGSGVASILTTRLFVS